MRRTSSIIGRPSPGVLIIGDFRDDDLLDDEVSPLLAARWLQPVANTLRRLIAWGNPTIRWRVCFSVIC